MEIASNEAFEEWKYHPITQRLMKMLLSDREAMKEGIVNNVFENEDEVKGRCRALAVLLNIEYSDLFSIERGGAYEQ